jgi:aminoglycoside phosphotransferase (APT) family kinase protein
VQKSAKLSQTDVVRTPPKSTMRAFAAMGEAEQATEAAPDGIDASGVEAWFRDNVADVEPPLAYEKIAGGRSNLTYSVNDSASGRWALRRPPLGKTLSSAHDMGREHRIISALAGTDVPVAPAVGFCDDDAVNGAPFYVMGWVEGPILRTRGEVEGHFDEAERRAIGERVVDTLVAIHAVEPDSVGLGDLGKREDYVARQLRRWQRQWEGWKTRDLELIEDVHGRLEARIPEQVSTTLVHGDYRLDNMILADSGEVAAVVDWELCTLGDPLGDVGMLMVYWAQQGDEMTALYDPPTLAEGFPTREELSARYAERSGRDLSQLDFYIALGYWKLAIILEGVYSRFAAGQYGSTDEAFQQFADVVVRLAEAADESERRLG